jgi:hypothetical protein
MFKRFIFISFLSITSNILWGQGADKKTTCIYINKENITIKAEVLKEQRKITADKNATYYWYASNAIMETQGGFEGQLLSGKYSVYFLSHNLREQGNFKRGLKQGEWIAWYENGKIQEITNWKNGHKTSWYKLNNEKGQLVVKAHFKNDLLNGKMLSYDGDNIVSEKRYKAGKEVIKKEKKERTQHLKLFRKKKSEQESGIIAPKKEKKKIRDYFKRKSKEKKPKQKRPKETDQKSIVKES